MGSQLEWLANVILPFSFTNSDLFDSKVTEKSKK